MPPSLRHLKEALPHCVAVGVVDMNEGVVLDACEDDASAREALAPQPSVATALLHSKEARTAARILDRMRGGDGSATFREAIVGADDTIYLLQRVDETRAMMATCVGVTNLGSVLAQARAIGSPPKTVTHASEE